MDSRLEIFVKRVSGLVFPSLLSSQQSGDAIRIIKSSDRIAKVVLKSSRSERVPDILKILILAAKAPVSAKDLPSLLSITCMSAYIRSSHGA